jgi:hypothetical protein
MTSALANRIGKLELKSPALAGGVTAIERWSVKPGTMGRRLHSTTYVQTATNPSRTIHHEDTVAAY